MAPDSHKIPLYFPKGKNTGQCCGCGAAFLGFCCSSWQSCRAVLKMSVFRCWGCKTTLLCEGVLVSAQNCHFLVWRMRAGEEQKGIVAGSCQLLLVW